MTDITFLCPRDLSDKIRAPAARLVPDGLGTLDREMGMADAHGLPAPAVRACLPVADAMAQGWIMRTPLVVTIRADPAAGVLNFQNADDTPLALIEMHHPAQIDAPRAPSEKATPLTVLNLWRVVLPAGCLASVRHPFNHFELPFTAFAGAVDCDVLDVAVNVPVIWTGDGADIHLPTGQPWCRSSRSSAACKCAAPISVATSRPRPPAALRHLRESTPKTPSMPANGAGGTRRKSHVHPIRCGRTPRHPANHLLSARHFARA
ncbi:hypothetical protein [uncultured Tateyamaria sp.]|uniref:hypothetical protein n=1 Tax=uncultured Tateyamaria sp. TaxID=455651 RepID=UPI0026128ABE|nr:hypothetical protein [uncultured Tateyamaria sp.]